MYEPPQSGNSPYDNGCYVYGENGWPLDFVSAMRTVEEEMGWFRSLSPEEQEGVLCQTPEETGHGQPLCGIVQPFDEEMPFRL